MKVVKPMCLSLLTRPFEFGGRMLFGVSVLGMVPMNGEREMLGEAALWQTAANELGQEGFLDAGIPKRRGEVLVAGNAWTREGSDRTKCRVRLSCGELSKELNVFGDRQFRGDQPGQPEPFESMPLTWENAFGGEGFAANPLGKGFKPVSDQQRGKYHPLPNIEYPNDMLYRPGQRTRPAGFGPIDLSWPQRLAKAGTYDKKWLEQHFPAYPPDIDWSYFNAASSDQQLAKPFLGDESWTLDNMHPEIPRLSGNLPGIRARCFFLRNGGDELEEMACQLTTVWFFPEVERMVLIYHTAIEVKEPDGRDLSALMIAADAFDAQRPLSHFGEVLVKRLDDEEGMFHLLNEDQLGPVGFRKNVGIDFDSIMRDIPESIRAVNMEKSLQAQLDQGAARLDEGMASLGLEPPKPESPPALQADMARLKNARLDELPELLKRLDEKSRETQSEMEEQAELNQARLQSTLKELQAQYPDQDMPDGMPQGGPPRQTAREQEAQVRSQIERMKATGMDAGLLEQHLLSDDMIGLMGQGEAGMARMYRMGAHLQPAIAENYSHGGSREQFLQLLRENASFSGSNFCAADLSELDLSGRDLRGIYLESAKLCNCNLAGAILDEAVLVRADLSGACLDKASLVGANLGQASFRNCSANEANFADVELGGIDFTGATLSGANLDEANLREARFSATRLDGASLRDILLMETSVAGTDFSAAVLSGAVFFKVDLDQCDFSTADLSKTVFLNCRGVNARFFKANLHNLRVVVDCDFRAADFSEAVLTEANFRGTLLSEARFDKANLDKADFSEISAEGANFYRAVAKGAQFIKADLRGADLRGMNLMEGSLERADLRSASLEGSNLFAVDLSRVHVDRQTNFDGSLTKRMRIHPRKFPVKDQT
jgi:uncharacterized protein YjbI with pentapeptide repeats